MGHVVNPISYRLYNIRYWNNNWFVSEKVNYSYIVNQDILIQRLLRRIFSFHLDSISVGLILVNLKIIRSFNSLSLYIYVHDSFLDLLFFNLKKDKMYLFVKSYYHQRFFRKYRGYMRSKKYGSNIRLLYILQKRLVFKYSRKLFFLFLKNKILRVFWDNFKGVLNYYLSKALVCGSTNLINIYIMGLSKMNVNASIISEFFFIRLKQYYTIWEVLKNINFLFKILMRKKRIVRGYKIMCSGRFSRKQRATYNWKSFGSLALSTVKSKLDYSYRTIALKYSSITIKVWVRLNRKKRNLVDFIV